MMNLNLLADACSDCWARGGNTSTCASICAGGGGGGTNATDKIVNPILPASLQAKTGQQFISGLLPAIIGFIFIVGTVGFFFMFLFGAIQWIFSGGDKGAVEQAKARITQAFIGLIILIATYAIISLVETFLGINILTIDIGSLKIQ